MCKLAKGAGTCDGVGDGNGRGDWIIGVESEEGERILSRTLAHVLIHYVHDNTTVA